MIKSLRMWRKGFMANKNFLGWRYAIRTEMRGIWGLKQLQNIWWWIRYRTYKKFHVVKLDLKPGYHDVDQRLIHANFCLLCEYVEKEEPFDRIDWDSDDHHKNAAKEIKELYKWWKEVYPNYDKNDPLFADDVKAPDHDSKVHSVDEDGDPLTYEWVDKPGQEEVKKKFHDACMLSHEYEIKKEKEIEDNMIRLIKIRGYLWT